jgi:hypothetical protein
MFITCILLICATVLFVLFLYRIKPFNSIPPELSNLDPTIPVIIQRGDYYGVAYAFQYVSSPDNAYISRNWYLLKNRWYKSDYAYGLIPDFPKQTERQAQNTYYWLTRTIEKETKETQKNLLEQEKYDKDTFKIVTLKQEEKDTNIYYGPFD